MKKINDIRNDFPMFRRKTDGNPIIYLDNAATSQKPESVIKAISHFYENYCGTIIFKALAFTEIFNEVPPSTGSPS